MDSLTETAKKIKEYPWNLSRVADANDYISFLSGLSNFFSTESVETDMLGHKKYGSFLSFPSLDEKKGPMIIFCNNYGVSIPDHSEKSPKIILLAYSEGIVYRHKEIIDFSSDHFAMVKLQALISDAKKFMNGEIEEDKFCIIEDDAPKKIFLEN